MDHSTAMGHAMEVLDDRLRAEPSAGGTSKTTIHKKAIHKITGSPSYAQLEEMRAGQFGNTGGREVIRSRLVPPLYPRLKSPDFSSS